MKFECEAVPLICIVVAATLTMACQHGQDDSTFHTEKTPSFTAYVHGPVASSPHRRGPEKAVYPRITSTDVERFIDDWFEARNTGDFDAYRQFYDPSFQGQWGAARPFQYDRQTWLRFRSRRFLRPRTVEISDLQFEIEADGARLWFVETDESGDHRLEGPVQLRLVRRRGKLSIASEVQFGARRSSVVRRASPVAPEEMALAITAGRGVHRSHYLVLDAELHSGRPIDTEEFSFADTSEYLGLHAVRKPVVFERRTSPLSSWRGRRLRLWDEEARSCDAVVTELYGLKQIESYPEGGPPWLDDSPVGESGEKDKLSREFIAEEIWRVGGSTRLVAALDFTEDCPIEDPLWGGVDGDEISALHPTELDHSLRKQLLARTAETKNFGIMERRFRRQTTDAERRALGYPRWWYYDGAEPQIRAFESQATGRIFAFVHAHSGFGCPEGPCAISELFEVRKQGLPQIRRLGDFEPGTYLAPIAMVEGIGGADPVVLAATASPRREIAFARAVETTYRVVGTVPIPNFSRGLRRHTTGPDRK